MLFPTKSGHLCGARNITTSSETTTKKEESSGYWSAFKAALSCCCFFRSHPSEASKLTETTTSVFKRSKSVESSDKLAVAPHASKSHGYEGRLHSKATENTPEIQLAKPADSSTALPKKPRLSRNPFKNGTLDRDKIGGALLIGGLVLSVVSTVFIFTGVLAPVGVIVIALDVAVLSAVAGALCLSTKECDPQS